nr:DC1, C1-like, zinc finger, RING/FYVE/PHD-type [Tanacetum cinerariifolium]
MEFKEIQLEEIQHEHPLNLIDLQFMHQDYVEDDDDFEDNDLVTVQKFKCTCDRCSLEIDWFHRYYYKCSNMSCNYSLHKFCAELSTTLQSPAHPAHILVLAKRTTNWRCSGCHTEYQHGMYYGCARCDYKIDLRCATFVEEKTIRHPGHPHPLVPVSYDPMLGKCFACGKEHRGGFYHCATCLNFVVNCDCLPCLIKLLVKSHRSHMLTLSYSFLDQVYDCECRICREEIYTEYWLYKCSKCMFYVHLDCAIKHRQLLHECSQSIHPDCAPLILKSEQGVNSSHNDLVYKFINMKFGDVRNTDDHEHPVSFVAGTKTDRSWKRSMMIALNAKNKLKIVTDEYIEPEIRSRLRALWERTNDMIISWIFNTIAEQISNSLSFLNTAAGLWNKLQEHYSQLDGHRIYQITNDLVQLKQNNCAIEVFYHKLKGLWDEVDALEAPYMCVCACSCENGRVNSKRDQRKRLIQFLMGLDECYANVRGQILLMQPMPTMAKAYSLIRQEEKQREGYTQQTTISAALSAHSNNTRTTYNNNRKNRNSTQGESSNRNFNQNDITVKRDENPIRTLGDYSKPSHKGYMNTIELPEGNNVVPLRSDTIRRTIDQSVGGKLHDLNAKESWALLEDLTLYDNESWNNPRDFAKLVKAITLPQDVPMVPMTLGIAWKILNKPLLNMHPHVPMKREVRKLNLMLESLRLVPQSSNTKFVCSKRDDGEVMFIEIIRDNDKPQNKGPNEDEGATTEGPTVEFFDTFPTRDELTYHKKLDPRENSNGGVSNFTRKIKRMHVFIGNFMIIEDISSIIDPWLSQVVQEKPFVEISNMTHDPQEGVVRFINGDDEVSYKMPYKIEKYNSLSNLKKEHTESVYLRNEEDKRRE